MKTPLILETNLAGLKPPTRGKVRDIYDLGETLLIVATDRISAFDVVLPNAVPEKGRVLTQISKYWFEKMSDIVRNHLISMEVKDYPVECRRHAAVLEGRSMLVKKSRYSILPPLRTGRTPSIRLRWSDARLRKTPISARPRNGYFFRFSRWSLPISSTWTCPLKACFITT